MTLEWMQADILNVVFLPQIEKLDPLTGQWMPCGESKTPEFDVTGLQEGKKYKFRVKAVNPEGESEPLEADKAIIAKNPFGKSLMRRSRTEEGKDHWRRKEGKEQSGEW